MEKLPEGISVVLKQEGRVLPFDKRGRISDVGHGGVVMTVLVNPEVNALAINVDGQKKVMPKKNYIANAAKGRAYKAKINLGEGLETSYPFNQVNLLFFGLEGRIDVWELAIVSYDRQIFLTVQKKYSCRCYCSDDQLSIPKFDCRWKSLVEVISKGGLINLDDLPSRSRYRPAKTKDLALNGEHTGRVLWWNHAMGSGAIVTHQGPARVLRDQIQAPGRLPPYLRPKETITYESLTAPKSRNTNFQLEARGVSLL